jgi:hypothetical protein
LTHAVLDLPVVPWCELFAQRLERLVQHVHIRVRDIVVLGVGQVAAVSRPGLRLQ